MMISPGLTTLLDRENAGSPATLQVDVIADLICPWCYLGKRRLDDALSAVHGPSLISWYPFQINPAMPSSGIAGLIWKNAKNVTKLCWPF